MTVEFIHTSKTRLWGRGRCALFEPALYKKCIRYAKKLQKLIS